LTNYVWLIYNQFVMINKSILYAIQIDGFKGKKNILLYNIY